ncbi:hypothetical protein J6590_025512 [Homalodisca vitripennis]|nr:hypothetical protein J6590_025512 [Homalodisca vitripennis]
MMKVGGKMKMLAVGQSVWPLTDDRLLLSTLVSRLPTYNFRPTVTIREGDDESGREDEDAVSGPRWLATD